jgi:hypothetical protein
MPEICTRRKIIGGTGLWLEPDSKMGLPPKIKQYGGRSKESEGEFVSCAECCVICVLFFGEVFR